MPPYTKKISKKAPKETPKASQNNPQRIPGDLWSALEASMETLETLPRALQEPPWASRRRLGVILKVSGPHFEALGMILKVSGPHFEPLGMILSPLGLIFYLWTSHFLTNSVFFQCSHSLCASVLQVLCYIVS